MLRLTMPGIMLLWVIGTMSVEAELRSTVLIRLPLADESVIISLREAGVLPRRHCSVVNRDEQTVRARRS